jgi:hypothetical protein
MCREYQTPPNIIYSNHMSGVQIIRYDIDIFKKYELLFKI